jgi:recombination protein RecA
MANTLRVAALQKQFESVLGDPLGWQFQPPRELVRTGVSEVDSATGGLPRGCLTEIIGPASSGRTSLLVSILAEATARGEVCALVDAEDCFDPSSAAKAGVRLERLIWVRSSHNAEHALKAADLLIHGGGFGIVVMDLGDTPLATARRISLTSWFRLRRAVEHTPTVLVTVSRQANAKTCASLILECKRERIAWSGTPGKVRELPLVPGSHLLRGICVRVTSKDRSKLCSPVFTALAI